MSFQVSDKVVCVDDSRHSFESVGDWPVKGKVYVVREMRPCHPLHIPITHLPDAHGPDVLLVGMMITCRSGIEHGWSPFRFRKLSEVKAENSSKRKEKSKP